MESFPSQGRIVEDSGWRVNTTATRERILVIEDEPDIREVIEFNLRAEGYRVSGASDGEEGLARARREFPDAILLDRMLPGMNGIELCRHLKADPDLRSIPVIMLTAKTEVDDIVSGLEAGADDYVTKPFKPKELLARLRAVVRRGTWDDPRPTERLVIEGVVINLARHAVLVDGEEVTLTATEFRLLSYLATNRGRVLSRNTLLTRVMGHSLELVDRNVDVHIASIRRKLGPYRKLIQTVRGVGYLFRH
jgi:DNA-binding response OmpR family regulator